MKLRITIFTVLRKLSCRGVLAFLMAGTASLADTLIQNGSFETNDGSEGSNAASWIKDGAYGIYKETGRGGVQSGVWAYVPGYGYANSGVYQNLAIPLESGKQYTLSWYQNPWFANNGLDVIVGVYSGAGARDQAGSYSSVSLDVDVTDTSANTWNLHTYTFTAVGNSTSVYFGTLTTAGRGDSADIDNVSLTEVLATVPTSSNDSLTIGEHTQAVLATGDFGSYSDPNSLPLAAVKITTLPSAGSLDYDTTGAGAWAAVAVDQEISAVDITAGRLRFTPVYYGNGSPYATIGFRVGNGTAFSIPYTLTANVTPVNDYVPTAANQTLGIAQGISWVLTAANFGFADADGNDTLQKIQVTQLPTAGSLTLSSVAVTIDQEITVADINAGNLRFTPVPTARGLAYATFGFKVSDGTFYSVASYTMTIDVMPVAVANSGSHIPFVSSGTLVGAAVFGNAGTYDGIPFSLWNTPFANSLALGSGVSVSLAVVGGDGGGGITGTLGGGQQFQYVVFPNSTPRGLELTFTGLNPASQYRFQFGYGDTRTAFAYNETATLTLSSGAPVPVQLAFGSAASGDEYALLTATVSKASSLVLLLPPQTVSGYHGPSQAGFAVHVLPPRGTLVSIF